MKALTMNVEELLLNAPYDQVHRCKMIFTAIANGEWDNAAHYARNAVDEVHNPEYHSWVVGMCNLAEFCDTRSNIQDHPL